MYGDKKNLFYVPGKRAHDLRYTNDTDVISLAVMDNKRVVTAHKDLNIICWDILEGMAKNFTPFISFFSKGWERHAVGGCSWFYRL